MSDWFARIAVGCDALAADYGLSWAIVCVALVAAVLALIALGFGPWRTRLAPGGRIARGHAGRWDDGLAGLWRLYRAIPAPPRDDRAADGTARSLGGARR